MDGTLLSIMILILREVDSSVKDSLMELSDALPLLRAESML